MKTYFLDLDCGSLGDQDVEIRYDGNIIDGVVVRHVYLLNTQIDLEPRLMTSDLEKIERLMMKDMDAKDALYWDKKLKACKEDRS